MKKFALTILTLVFLPALASAQGYYIPWYDYLNIPADFSTFPNLLYFVLIPFLGTFTIIWGILTNIRLFQVPRVNILIAFVFAMALLYSTALTSLTFYLFQAGGIFGVISFFVLFFVLSTLFTARRMGVSYADTKRTYREIEIAAGRELKDSVKFSRDLKSVSSNLYNLDRRIIKTKADLARVKIESERANSILQAINSMSEDAARKRFGKSKRSMIDHYNRLKTTSLRHKKILTTQLMKLNLQRDKLKQLEIKINSKL